VIALLLTGCATSTVNPSHTEKLQANEKNTAVFLVTPRDGTYGNHTYTGSGKNVADAFEQALAKQGMVVVRGPGFTALNDVFSEAQARGCTYALVPTISHWEDRATEWSGKADRLTIMVRVYRVVDQRELSNAELAGKSSWITLGGDHPQDLLQEPIDQYVSSLMP